MKWKNIITVYLKELRDSLRDRRTLLSTILIPSLVIPLLSLGVGKVATSVVKTAQEDIPKVAILGESGAPGLVGTLKKSPRLEVVPTPEDWKTAIAEKKLRAVLHLPENFEAELKSGGSPLVMVYHYSSELKSENGARVVEQLLGEFRELTLSARLDERGLPKTFVRPFDIRRENVAPPEKVGGNLFGGIVPYLIIILCFTGAMNPAMDLTAGEKERGTMETLLCSPVARSEIVMGKFLMVLTGSLMAMSCTLISLGGTLLLAKDALKSLPMIDPLGCAGVLALILPVAVMFAAVAFTISLFAKSLKEAQSYLGPLVFVVIMPAIIGMLPGVELNWKLALVPLLNVSLACKEMLSGVWHWDYLALIFGSSCLYAAGALKLAVRMFNREDVLFRS